MKIVTQIFLIFLLSINVNAGEYNESNQVDYWVKADRLLRRTCPKVDCGSVGFLTYRSKVIVYEIRNGWGRITKPYDAACVNGRSQYVDSGNNKCIIHNGIKNGKFSEWVLMSEVSEQRPDDPAKNTKGLELAVSQSDDFRIYKDKFVMAARELIKSKQCTESELKEMGGFMKSVNNYPNRAVYFTYCGGMSAGNRVYVDVSTGEIFK